MFLYRSCNTKRVVGLFMAMMLCTLMHGQKQYVLEYLGFADGLPSLNVDGITQDSNGLIWIASFHTGLVRYDGTTFKVFNQAPESDLRISSDLVRDVVIDPKGRLWVAHFQGIDVIDIHSYKVLNRIPLLGRGKVNGQGQSLYLQPNGDIWVATYNNGIFRIPGGGPNAAIQVDSTSNFLYINQTPDGKIFTFSDLTGMYVFENNRFVPTFPILNFHERGATKIKPIENPDGLLVGFRLVHSDNQVEEYQYSSQFNKFISGLPEDGISVSTAPEMARKMLEIASPLENGALYKLPLKRIRTIKG